MRLNLETLSGLWDKVASIGRPRGQGVSVLPLWWELFGGAVSGTAAGDLGFTAPGLQPLHAGLCGR